MKKAFIDYWISLLKPIFPSGARIKKEYDGHLVLEIDWLLKNDPTRPSKRSRIIKLIIKEEAIDDCQDYILAGEKLVEIVKARYAEFTPDHKKPAMGSRPIEEWIVKSSDLN